MNEKSPPCFFLGANTPKGYVSKFGELQNYGKESICIMLKGGPGTGKSTVLKKIASMLKEKKKPFELVFCSADADSLDAVSTADGKISVIDATLPHSSEPKYPGAFEHIFSLSDFWNVRVLMENREKIKSLFDKNRALHERARKYITVASGLLEEAAKLYSEAVSGEKVISAAMKIVKRELPNRKSGSGREKIRFLSAVTNKGITFFDSTVKELCDKIYVLEDDCGAVSKIFMNTLRKIALENGYDIITCRCGASFGEKNEHIIIPQMKLGFITSNKRHFFSGTTFRVIHAKRFADTKKENKHKIKIRFLLRTASQILTEATEAMREAKAVHDELEKIYTKAMDFDKVNEKTDELLDFIGKNII